MDLSTATFPAKLAYYRRKYGLAHAAGSYVGRLSSGFWRLAGPRLTRSYMRRWSEAHDRPRVLNLGGGSHCLDGCLTVDIDARADAYVDVTTPLPFANASVDAIFCEEVIEHVDYPTGLRLLRECHRILVPSGVLRLTTPDLDWFARRVLAESQAWVEANSIFYDHGHRCVYTPRALLERCLGAGFVDPRPSSYRDASSRLGHLDSHADRFAHPPEMSQYLEVFKPAAAQ